MGEMKRIVFFSLMCLMVFSVQAQQDATSKDYVDLGLPSGTMWKSSNEKGGFYTYDEAVLQFGNRLPTMEQWVELKDKCQWSWDSSGIKVTGPNGNSIVLPALGYRNCNGNIYNVGSHGYYWSSTPDGSDENDAWFLKFNSDEVSMGSRYRCHVRSVRLVKN